MYCVNCGVKLGDSEKNCPLCGTAVYHPDIQRPKGEPLYPENSHYTPAVTSRGAQIIATAVFLLPMLITFQCDFRISGGITWSGYVIGALLVAYCALVLPNWFPKPNPMVFCGVDFVAIGLYLFYINRVTGGDWFLTFALPITCAMGIFCTGLLALLRHCRGSKLYILGGALTVLGLFILGLELLLWVTFDAVGFYGWSAYPMTVLAVLGLTLICLGLNRRAREKMERKFFI